MTTAKCPLVACSGEMICLGSRSGGRKVAPVVGNSEENERKGKLEKKHRQIPLLCTWYISRRNQETWRELCSRGRVLHTPDFDFYAGITLLYWNTTIARNPSQRGPPAGLGWLQEEGPSNGLAHRVGYAAWPCEARQINRSSCTWRGRFVRSVGCEGGL